MADALHFHIHCPSSSPPSKEDTSLQQYFGPLISHQVFGEQEQIQGYEGLSVDVTLSPKYLRPLVKVVYEKKAPAFATIDNIEKKLQDHYGLIYTDEAEYAAKVLEVEKEMGNFGEKVTEIEGGYEVYKVCVTEGQGDDDAKKDFTSLHHYLQTILLFFIDGASNIGTSSFWQYFIVY